MLRRVTVPIALLLVLASPAVVSAGDSDGEIEVESVDGEGEEGGEETLEQLQLGSNAESEAKASEEDGEFDVQVVSDGAESSEKATRDGSTADSDPSEGLADARRAMQSGKPRQTIAHLTESHPELRGAEPTDVRREGSSRPDALKLLLDATVASGGAFDWTPSADRLSGTQRRGHLERAYRLARSLAETAGLDLDGLVGRAIGQLADRDDSPASMLLRKHRATGGDLNAKGFRSLIGVLESRGLGDQLSNLSGLCRQMTGGAEVCKKLGSALHGESGLPTKVPADRDRTTSDTEKNPVDRPSREAIDRAKDKLQGIDF